MEHRKSLSGPFLELGDILRSRGEELALWAVQTLSDPSPLHMAALGWYGVATVLLWKGIERVLLHYSKKF